VLSFYSVSYFFPTILFEALTFSLDVCSTHATTTFTIVFSAFQLQFHFQRAILQSIALQATTDDHVFDALDRKFFLRFDGTDVLSLLSLSVGIFPLTHSVRCS